MKPTILPMTQALRVLAAAKVPHESRCYDFTEHGGRHTGLTETAW